MFKNKVFIVFINIFKTALSRFLISLSIKRILDSSKIIKREYVLYSYLRFNKINLFIIRIIPFSYFIGYILEITFLSRYDLKNDV